ncbi:MAG: HAMP domain-containing sensor histidine kinase [Thermomicrobiales bacterium]
MSLGTRIALGVAVVLALTLAVLGVAMTGATRIVLTAEVDKRLTDSLGRFRGRPDWGAEDIFGPHGVNGRGDHDDDYLPGGPLSLNSRSVGFFGFDRDGVLRVQMPSETSNRPDPLPRFPPIPSPQVTAMLGKIVTLPAVDGSGTYRVLMFPGPAGSTLAATASLHRVDDAVAQLMRVLAVAGTVALIIAALASWWVIRLGLRPVDRMVATAAAIAAGDLSRRVPDAQPGTELGRLGIALNAMLTQIEAGIREREAGEARLRRFVADAAHELRTPLTSLRGYAELYRQGALPSPDAVAHAMSRIESEGGRMARLVDDLLLLARTDQGRPLEREPVDLSRLAREAADDFSAANPERTLTRELADSAVVIGDPVRLRQAIDNLLANVRTHTPVGTPARVQVTRNGQWAEVTVADAGPGIAPTDQERIFERFWRGDPARRRASGSGAGLGLSIVDALVKAHGGAVAVQSEPGDGAAFTIRLPLAPPGS